MPGNKLIFQSAEAARDAITNEANIKIQKLYESWADELQERAEYYGRKTASSYGLKKLNTLQLRAQMQETARKISKEIEGVAKNSIYLVASSVVEANNDWLKSLGFPAEGAFASIPDQTVRRLVTGQIYQGGWNLSSAIWGDNQDTLAKLYELTAKGLAQNMSVYDISKMLEQYVSPNRKLPWNLTMPDGKKIYRKQVDYNAQRLVRTLTQHGYQTSFIAVTEKNPFITKVIWRANGSRVCPLCMDRDGKEYNKNEVPMDHPNGMCTMEPKVVDDLTDQLANWINSPDGTFPEIDEFAKEFGYTPEIKPSVKHSIPKKEVTTPKGKYGSDIFGRQYTKQEYQDRLKTLNTFSDYHYHATTESALSGIKSKGIIPKRGHLGDEVYMAKTEESAVKWTTSTSTSGQVILRVNNKYLAKTDYMDYDMTKSGEGSTGMTIPAKEVEVKTSNGEWISIKDAVVSYMRGKPNIIKRPK